MDIGDEVGMRETMSHTTHTMKYRDCTIYKKIKYIIMKIHFFK